MGITEPLLATDADCAQIARVHIQPESKTVSALTTMVSGTAGPEATITYITAQLQRSITSTYSKYFVIKDTETGEVISYANWVLPHSAQDELEEKSRLAALPILYRPEGMNLELRGEFMEKVLNMRETCLAGHKHFICGNLATAPRHQKRGAASKLMRWPFEQADKEGAIVFLETNLNGPAISLYKHLGFVQVNDGISIDLSNYGGEGVHTHVPMIREPRNQSDTCA